MIVFGLYPRYFREKGPPNLCSAERQVSVVIDCFVKMNRYI